MSAGGVESAVSPILAGVVSQSPGRNVWACTINLLCFCGPWAAEHVIAIQWESEHEESFSAVKPESGQIRVDNSRALALRKLDRNVLFGFPGLLWAKFSATYVTRCAYPVCPNVHARIFSSACAHSGYLSNAQQSVDTKLFPVIKTFLWAINCRNITRISQR